MAGLSMQMEWKTRLCQVGEKLGYFHVWEHYSKPLEASPLMGGAPAGIFSKVFAIVEFSDGVRRVDPSEIVFCDEENRMLSEIDKRKREGFMMIGKNRLRDLFFSTNEQLISDYEELLQLHNNQIGRCSTCTNYIPTDAPGFVTDYGKCRLDNPDFYERVCDPGNSITCDLYVEDKETVKTINNEIQKLKGENVINDQN